LILHIKGSFVGFSDILWTSADGKSWENSGTSPFIERWGHTILEFKNKLWIAAGAFDENGKVWSSDDGLK
jgi:hypothetical protein